MWSVALFVCIAWMISLCLHEFGHAIVAYWGGDKSVKDKGYLTLNPLKYTEPGMSLMLPLMFLLVGGIALPGGAVYINTHRLRGRLWKSAVSAAGPLANMIVVLLMSLPFLLGFYQEVDIFPQSTQLFPFMAALAFVINLNIYIVFINLLPIPSLDGYGIIEPWLPSKIRQLFGKFAQFGIWVLIGLLWFVPPVNQFLWGITNKISNFFKVPERLSELGGALFNQYSLYLVLGLIAILWIFRDKKQDFFRKGTQLLGTNNYHEAIANFDQAIEIQPSYSEAWYMKGYALFSLEKYQKALVAYDRALENNPDYVDAWHDRGSILRNLGRNQEAIASYDKAIEIQPDYALAWHNRGKALFAMEIYEEAINSFDKAIQSESNNADAWISKGDVYKKLKSYEEAISAYNQAMLVKPKSNGWLYQIQILRQLGDYQRIIEVCERKLQFQADDGEVWYIKGLSLDKLNRQQEATVSYNQAVTSYDKLAKGKPQNPEIFYEKGVLLEKLQRHPEAIAVYRKAISLYEGILKRQPQDIGIWIKKARLLENVEEYDEALKAYEEVITLKSDFFPAWCSKGMILAKLHRHQEAVTAYDKALGIRPNECSIWFMRGQAMAALSDYDTAIGCYDRALTIFTEFYGFWLYRGVALYLLQQYDAANSSYDEALELEPNSVKVWHDKGLALMKLHTYHQAIAAFDKAIELDPNLGEAWYNKACCYALQGNIQRVNHCLQQAYELDSTRFKAMVKEDNDFDSIRTHPDFS